MPLTCKRSGNEDRGKTPDTPNKRCITNVPVLGPNVLVIYITSAVDRNTENNEDYNRNYLEQAEPIFELKGSKSKLEEDVLRELRSMDSYSPRHTP